MKNDYKEKIEEINNELPQKMISWGRRDAEEWHTTQLVSLMCDFAESCLPEEKTNEDFMKELNVPSSDFSYGHSHGFNLALKEQRQRIAEMRKSYL